LGYRKVAEPQSLASFKKEPDCDKTQKQETQRQPVK